MAGAARRPLVAGNWKMNGLRVSAAEFEKMVSGATAIASRVDLMICPPATILAGLAAMARGTRLRLGGQDCHPEASGAFTGDISAEMLADAGASAVIVGHSERRTLHAETDALVQAKARAAWRAGLIAIVCVGETRAEREAGDTLKILGRQLAGSLPDGVTGENLVVAYEPVWAIGSGLTPTVDDVGTAHEYIRQTLAARFGTAAGAIRVLYGGSVKPSNAVELMAAPDVDGALVGGASLAASDFLGIAQVYR
jgi:triosephosphate isomerase